MDLLNKDMRCDEKLFVMEPPEYVRCGICSHVAHNPVQLLNCGHKFCSPCYQRHKQTSELKMETLTCPVDREALDVGRVCEDVALRRMIAKLPVRCVNTEKGCTWVGDLADITEHRVKCEYGVDNSKYEEVIALVRVLYDRVDRYEASLAEKEREIVSERYQLNEMKAKFERKLSEVDRLYNDLESTRKIFEKLECEIRKTRENGQITEVKLGEMAEIFGQLKCKVDTTTTSFRQRIDSVENKTFILETDLRLLQQKCEKKETEKKAKPAEEARTKKPLDETKSLDPLKSSEPVEIILRSNSEPEQATSIAENAKPVPLQPRKRGLIKMQIHKSRLPRDAVISMDNRVTFKPQTYSTVVFPRGELSRGQRGCFEVEIVFKEQCVLNVGWATTRLVNTVGGGEHGYSLRITPTSCDKRYNNKHQKYGKRPAGCGVKIVIGVALDMKAGRMLFGLNGFWESPMGVAFSDIDTGQNFFPAISFGSGDLRVNFGERNFIFGPPDDSFRKLVDLVDRTT